MVTPTQQRVHKLIRYELGIGVAAVLLAVADHQVHLSFGCVESCRERPPKLLEIDLADYDLVFCNEITEEIGA